MAKNPPHCQAVNPNAYCHPCEEEASSPTSPQIETPLFSLIDTNVPGLTYRHTDHHQPSAHPSNLELELARVQQYLKSCAEIIVVWCLV